MVTEAPNVRSAGGRHAKPNTRRPVICLSFQREHAKGAAELGIWTSDGLIRQGLKPVNRPPLTIPTRAGIVILPGVAPCWSPETGTQGDTGRGGRDSEEPAPRDAAQQPFVSRSARLANSWTFHRNLLFRELFVSLGNQQSF